MVSSTKLPGRVNIEERTLFSKKELDVGKKFDFTEGKVQYLGVLIIKKLDKNKYLCQIDVIKTI